MKYLSIFLFSIALLFTACTKDDDQQERDIPPPEALVLGQVAFKVEPGSACPVFYDADALDLCDGKIKDIKFRSTGTVSYGPANTQCMYAGGNTSVLIEGSGNMSHIGNFTLELSYCLLFLPEQNPQLIYPPFGTLTAANGDQLYIHLTAADRATGWQHYVINGGTGRYEDACGYWDLCGQLDEATGTFVHEGQGKLRY